MVTPGNALTTGGIHVSKKSYSVAMKSDEEDDGEKRGEGKEEKGYWLDRQMSQPNQTVSHEASALNKRFPVVIAAGASRGAQVSTRVGILGVFFGARIRSSLQS